MRSYRSEWAMLQTGSIVSSGPRLQSKAMSVSFALPESLYCWRQWLLVPLKIGWGCTEWSTPFAGCSTRRIWTRPSPTVELRRLNPACEISSTVDLTLLAAVRRAGPEGIRAEEESISIFSTWSGRRVAIWGMRREDSVLPPQQLQQLGECSWHFNWAIQ